MSKLTLFINGQRTTYQTTSLSFSLGQMAHTFSATIPNVDISEPLPVEFKLSGETVFIGQIDSVSDAVSGAEDKISINGRSKSANLIDSRIKIDAIYNQRFDQLLKTIAGDFGLSVKSNVSVAELPLVPEFQINAESPIANLSQIAKQQNLILVEQNGVLVIERPGQFTEKNIKLKVGVNVESLAIKKNWADQFYHYEIQGAWDDAQAIVFNKAIDTCRKKIIIADKLQDEASCRTRATYERNIAIAKGLSASATLPGLYSELTGATLNKLLSAQKNEFKEYLLVKSISLNASASSESTSVELFRPFGE